jgi:hypothetical protein
MRRREVLEMDVSGLLLVIGNKSRGTTRNNYDQQRDGELSHKYLSQANLQILKRSSMNITACWLHLLDNIYAE